MHLPWAGIDSMPQELQRYVTQLREIEIEKRGMHHLVMTTPIVCLNEACSL